MQVNGVYFAKNSKNTPLNGIFVKNIAKIGTQPMQNFMQKGVVAQSIRGLILQSKDFVLKCIHKRWW